MKTSIYFLAAVLSAISSFAQVEPTGTISRSPAAENANQFGLAGTAITNRAGRTFAPDQIQTQLSELRRAVEETTPVLNAVTESYSNSTANAKPSVVGGIANALGGLLNRNTNNASAQSSSGTTNALGKILQGVLSAAAGDASQTNASEFRDLVALQEHLQAITPLLQRLGVSNNTPSSLGIGGTGDASTIEKGENKRD